MGGGTVWARRVPKGPFGGIRKGVFRNYPRFRNFDSETKFRNYDSRIRELPKQKSLDSGTTFARIQKLSSLDSETTGTPYGNYTPEASEN